VRYIIDECDVCGVRVERWDRKVDPDEREMPPSGWHAEWPTGRLACATCAEPVRVQWAAESAWRQRQSAALAAPLDRYKAEEQEWRAANPPPPAAVLAWRGGGE